MVGEMHGSPSDKEASTKGPESSRTLSTATTGKTDVSPSDKDVSAQGPDSLKSLPSAASDEIDAFPDDKESSNKDPSRRIHIEQAESETYDIIIVGHGISGGINARELCNKAKSILVIERQGDHHGSHISSDAVDRRWTGNSMYYFGGHNATWAPFASRIHKDVLTKYFPTSVRDGLVNEYYTKAEALIPEAVHTPREGSITARLIKQLNQSLEHDEEQWQGGCITSELRQLPSSQGGDTPKDAYKKERDHPHFKILLETEVRSLTFDKHERTTVTGVMVHSAGGKVSYISLNPEGRVVLAAGSIASPAILLRSGVDLKEQGGLHLTGHDIVFRTQHFRYCVPSDRPDIRSTKLQKYMRLPNETIHVNMSIDTSPILPRGRVHWYDDIPKWVIAFMRPKPLDSRISIEMVDDEPVVTSQARSSKKRHTDSLKAVATDAIDTLEKVLSVEFPGDASPGPREPFFKFLELGGIAYDLGTLPMRREDTMIGCVDKDLRLIGYHGVYVCDLSVFPVSPEVNPTLTLVALALRLSQKIVDLWEGATSDGSDTARITNTSKSKIKVFVANRAGMHLQGEDEYTVLDTGGDGSRTTRRRKNGMVEAVYVFRLDKSGEFERDPEICTVIPGGHGLEVPN
ncbi:FAD/NAD-P-binding domain-containing protein [Stereum hirsutum FP-91666 SS1]|uniref:FAD/NAD-P-binding domain-containing protein n=1 Tax=Stereum hirsutum (strain FP-91666) TaxID=721885 RepID=UPI000444A443|nr:FAD/NAD-P-binding domain-containing protein [Stereum hirsutum FP-91666 SS1]EIM81524.1 FAD/NAD-P-binding domain-containing protein [Stereum hirsutum FP-91666 SS1]